MTTFNPLATIYSPQGQTVTYNFAPPSFNSAPTSSAPTPTVFLSRLTPTTNEAQLMALGSPFGQVKSARFVQRAQEGKRGSAGQGSTGKVDSNCSEIRRESSLVSSFTFVGMAASGSSCLGVGYKVGFARETLKEKLERLADPFETNVYVKNLPASYSTQALERLFAPSIIVSSKILESGNGGALGKGVALVRLQTRDEAHSAVDALHGRILPGAQGPLVCRFADSPGQKFVREEAAKLKRKDLDSPTSSTGSWTSSMPGGSLPESWATPMSSPQTPSSPILGGYQQIFNPLGFPYNNLSFYPTPQASYLMQAQQQQAFNGLAAGGGGGGGQHAFASFPSSSATSATSSTFGPVGLGLTHPALGNNNNNKFAAAGGGGVDDDSWSRIHW
ncbi:hypothetical protein BDY24DRAFT_433301 [Mrakia frigida]|uniref:uncharacterized protein n=1 Tax=Mrakia frigida TaxID=29902 RepID=UPI003FCC1624